ncbi:UPF0665 family protein [Escovopsis weberi]|uniref:UPF0665 family protein n=1 Tax=Escovopsis weberi TaxID=150374 RepID=A0A0M8MV34_ESCWE|nr:UPF0665 family protein [Escovopsis weberi]
MHYIRFMRAPALSRSGKRLLLELVLTINTDLSDAFLSPAQPVEVMIYAEVLTGHGSPLIYVLAGPGQIIWRSGLRVLKPTMDVPASVQAHLRAGQEVRICASTRSSMSASGVARIVASVTPGAAAAAAEGQVMPAYFVLRNGGEGRDGGGVGGDVDLGIRKLALDAEAAVEFEEELGESMARHIWDGGVIALCKMADACLSGARREEEEKKKKKEGEEDQDGLSPCMGRFRELVAAEKHVNVLELGCGIGVLGVGLAAVYARMSLAGHTCSILMTDLEDAEPRTRANMARLGPASCARGGPVELSYETLDWEDGRAGRLGEGARGRRWDLMMLADCTYNTDTLPALVGTLSALHRSNQGHEAGRPSRLFLATKNRHDSEREVFGLLAGEGWEVLGREELSLPVLGDDAQTVELYLFEKS